MADGVSIEIIPENCRGCRRCEVACSWHDPGPLNPRLAGINVMKLDAGRRDYPVINRECLERSCGKTDRRNAALQEPACVRACLFGALRMKQREADDE